MDTNKSEALDMLVEEVTECIHDSDHFYEAVCEVIENNPEMLAISVLWDHVSEETDGLVYDLVERLYSEYVWDTARNQMIDHLASLLTFQPLEQSSPISDYCDNVEKYAQAYEEVSHG